jgi:hypothetical protein
MLICALKISDVTDESMAIDMSEKLLDLSEEVCSMPDRYLRTKKIKVLGAKMEHFRKRCVRKGWQEPLNRLQECFEMLKEAEQEAESFTNMLFKCR